MKKQFSLYKLGIIPLIILCCSVNAQTTGLNAHLNTSSSKEVAMNDDKELPAFSSYSAFTAKAVKNFSKNFKDADNAEWAETIDGYKAEFTKDGIETKVFYNRKGQWVASVRNYFEDQLPKDVRHRVKSKYYDYNIFYVQEITAGEKMAYLVKIEDKDSIKIIRLADDEMEEYLVIEKSK